jgi:hypothetical protein
MAEQAYWLVTARDGLLHKLPEGTSQTRCGQWKKLEVKPAASETRWCPGCVKARKPTRVLDLGQ